MNENLKVLIVDDHSIFRRGLVFTLKNIPAVQYCSEAASAQEAIRQLENEKIDIVFMDIRMKGIDGLEATAIIRDRYPEVLVIALSSYDDQELVEQMFKLGAKGYLLKNTEQEELERAIATVISGEYYYSAEVSPALLRRLSGQLIPNPSNNEPLVLLPLEINILRSICMQKSSQEIAGDMNTSIKNIEYHRSVLFKKTGTKNVAGLVVFAIKNNFFNPS